MEVHPTHTKVIFAENRREAKEKYLNLNIQPDHDQDPTIDVRKVNEEEGFDETSPFNLFGEVSVGPDIMEVIRKNVGQAYVIYYLEKLKVS